MRGDAKCNADEPARRVGAPRARQARKVDLDGAVFELETVQLRNRLAVEAGSRHEPQCLLAFVGDRLRNGVDELHAIAVFDGNAPGG